MYKVAKKKQKINEKIIRLRLEQTKIDEKINNLTWIKNKGVYIRRKNRLVIKKNKIGWEIQGLLMKLKILGEQS